MTLSDWQENCFPEIDGIYQIKTPDGNKYYCLFQKEEGGWGVGNVTVDKVKSQLLSGIWYPCSYNNQSKVAWRGVIDE